MPVGSKAVKIFLVVVGGALGMVLIAALLFGVFFDINRYKPQIEAAMSKALAMNVAIEGPLSMAAASGLQVKLRGVRVSNQGAQLAFVDELDLSIPVLSVIRGEIAYNAIVVKGADRKSTRLNSSHRQ